MAARQQRLLSVIIPFVTLITGTLSIGMGPVKKADAGIANTSPTVSASDTLTSDSVGSVVSPGSDSGAKTINPSTSDDSTKSTVTDTSATTSETLGSSKIDSKKPGTVLERNSESIDSGGAGVITKDSAIKTTGMAPPPPPPISNVSPSVRKSPPLISENPPPKKQGTKISITTFNEGENDPNTINIIQSPDAKNKLKKVSITSTDAGATKVGLTLSKDENANENVDGKASVTSSLKDRTADAKTKSSVVATDASKSDSASVASNAETSSMEKAANTETISSSDSIATSDSRTSLTGEGDRRQSSRFIAGQGSRTAETGTKTRADASLVPSDASASVSGMRTGSDTGTSVKKAGMGAGSVVEQTGEIETSASSSSAGSNTETSVLGAAMTDATDPVFTPDASTGSSMDNTVAMEPPPPMFGGHDNLSNVKISESTVDSSTMSEARSSSSEVTGADTAASTDVEATSDFSSGSEVDSPPLPPVNGGKDVQPTETIADSNVDSSAAMPGTKSVLGVATSDTSAAVNAMSSSDTSTMTGVGDSSPLGEAFGQDNMSGKKVSESNMDSTITKSKSTSSVLGASNTDTTASMDAASTTDSGTDSTSDDSGAMEAPPPLTGDSSMKMASSSEMGTGPGVDSPMSGSQDTSLTDTITDSGVDTSISKSESRSSVMGISTTDTTGSMDKTSTFDSGTGSRSKEIGSMEPPPPPTIDNQDRSASMDTSAADSGSESSVLGVSIEDTASSADKTSSSLSGTGSEVNEVGSSELPPPPVTGSKDISASEGSFASVSGRESSVLGVSKTDTTTSEVSASITDLSTGSMVDNVGAMEPPLPPVVEGQDTPGKETITDASVDASSSFSGTKTSVLGVSATDTVSSTDTVSTQDMDTGANLDDSGAIGPPPPPVAGSQASSSAEEKAIDSSLDTSASRSEGKSSVLGVSTADTTSSMEVGAISDMQTGSRQDDSGAMGPLPTPMSGGQDTLSKEKITDIDPDASTSVSVLGVSATNATSSVSASTSDSSSDSQIGEFGVMGRPPPPMTGVQDERSTATRSDTSLDASSSTTDTASAIGAASSFNTGIGLTVSESDGIGPPPPPVTGGQGEPSIEEITSSSLDSALSMAETDSNAGTVAGQVHSLRQPPPPMFDVQGTDVTSTSVSEVPVGESAVAPIDAATTDVSADSAIGATPPGQSSPVHGDGSVVSKESITESRIESSSNTLSVSDTRTPMTEPAPEMAGMGSGSAVAESQPADGPPPPPPPFLASPDASPTQQPPLPSSDAGPAGGIIDSTVNSPELSDSRSPMTEAEETLSGTSVSTSGLNTAVLPEGSLPGQSPPTSAGVDTRATLETSESSSNISKSVTAASEISTAADTAASVDAAPTLALGTTVAAKPQQSSLATLDRTSSLDTTSGDVNMPPPPPFNDISTSVGKSPSSKEKGTKISITTFNEGEKDPTRINIISSPDAENKLKKVSISSTDEGTTKVRLTLSKDKNATDTFADVGSSSSSKGISDTAVELRKVKKIPPISEAPPPIKETPLDAPPPIIFGREPQPSGFRPEENLTKLKLERPIMLEETTVEAIPPPIQFFSPAEPKDKPPPRDNRILNIKRDETVTEHTVSKESKTIHTTWSATSPDTSRAEQKRIGSSTQRAQTPGSNVSHKLFDADSLSSGLVPTTVQNKKTGTLKTDSSVTVDASPEQTGTDSLKLQTDTFIKEVDTKLKKRPVTTERMALKTDETQTWLKASHKGGDKNTVKDAPAPPLKKKKIGLGSMMDVFYAQMNYQPKASRDQTVIKGKSSYDVGESMTVSQPPKILPDKGTKMVFFGTRQPSLFPLNTTPQPSIASKAVKYDSTNIEWLPLGSAPSASPWQQLPPARVFSRSKPRIILKEGVGIPSKPPPLESNMLSDSPSFAFDFSKNIKYSPAEYRSKSSVSIAKDVDFTKNLKYSPHTPVSTATAKDTIDFTKNMKYSSHTPVSRSSLSIAKDSKDLTKTIKYSPHTQVYGSSLAIAKDKLDSQPIFKPFNAQSSVTFGRITPYSISQTPYGDSQAWRTQSTTWNQQDSSRTLVKSKLSSPVDRPHVGETASSSSLLMRLHTRPPKELEETGVPVKRIGAASRTVIKTASQPLPTNQGQIWNKYRFKSSVNTKLTGTMRGPSLPSIVNQRGFKSPSNMKQTNTIRVESQPSIVNQGDRAAEQSPVTNVLRHARDSCSKLVPSMKATHPVGYNLLASLDSINNPFIRKLVCRIIELLSQENYDRYSTESEEKSVPASLGSASVPGKTQQKSIPDGTSISDRSISLWKSGGSGVWAEGAVGPKSRQKRVTESVAGYTVNPHIHELHPTSLDNPKVVDRSALIVPPTSIENEENSVSMNPQVPIVHGIKAPSKSIFKVPGFDDVFQNGNSVGAKKYYVKSSKETKKESDSLYTSGGHTTIVKTLSMNTSGGTTTSKTNKDMIADAWSIIRTLPQFQKKKLSTQKEVVESKPSVNGNSANDYFGPVDILSLFRPMVRNVNYQTGYKLSGHASAKEHQKNVPYLVATKDKYAKSAPTTVRTTTLLTTPPLITTTTGPPTKPTTQGIPPPIFNVTIPTTTTTTTPRPMPDLAILGEVKKTQVTDNTPVEVDLFDPKYLCADCVFVNGRCFLPDVSHCNKYIECVEGPPLRSFARECAIGLFFNRTTFLCTHPEFTYCPSDKCQRPGVAQYALPGHCRHRWYCHMTEGRIFPNIDCCPENGAFKEGVGCVNDTSCSEPCSLQTQSHQQLPTGCMLKKTDAKDKYFDVNANMIRPCAPGTLFNEARCTCVQNVESERGPNRTGSLDSCVAVLTLHFNDSSMHGFSDRSNTRQSIGIESVARTQNGTAQFAGNGRIKLWRFSNLMFGIVFAVRLNFISSQKSPRYQTLISNCDPAQPTLEPSFDIRIDTKYSEVIFSVKAYKTEKSVIKSFYKPGQWNSVIFIYDGERAIGGVNDRVRNLFSLGGIETRPVPLSMGFCTDAGFVGYMDEVYMYEDCIPDDMFDIFHSVLE